MSVCVPIPDPTNSSDKAQISVSELEAVKDANAHHNLLLKMVTKYFSSHFADVIRVNIEYDGEALSGKIGKYEVKAFLTRRHENQLHEECRTIDYSVEDIDECVLGLHRCQLDTTVCVNTPGSYECKCKQDDFFGIENR